MSAFKKWVFSAALMAGLLWNGLAKADLVQIGYTDTNGAAVTKTLSATGPNYGNPKSTVTLWLSGGLNRMVKVLLKDSSGNLAGSAASQLLTAADSFTLGGNTYYGTQVTLPAPADGNYTLAAQILDSSGAVVQETDYPWTVSTVAPTYTCLWTGQCLAAGQGESIGWDYGETWEVQGLTSGVPIASVKLDVLLPDGTAAASATITKFVNGTAVFSPLNSSLNLPGGFGALGDKDTTFRTTITDAAGNTVSVENPVHFISPGPGAKIVGIYDATYTGNLLAGSPFTGYRAYSPGMTVNDYHLKFVMAVPKGMLTTDPYPYIWYGSGAPITVAYSDAQYEYFIWTTTYGAATWPGGVTRSGYWDAYAWSYNVVLGANVPPPPVLVSEQRKWSDIGWEPGQPVDAHLGMARQSAVLQEVEPTVEARPYDQTYSGAFGSCVVPAGSTTCSVVVNTTFSGPDGAVYGDVVTDNADPAYTTGWTGAYHVEWVFTPPTISAPSLDPNTKSLKALVTNDDGPWGTNGLASFTVTATNQAQVATQVHGTVTRLSAGSYSVAADLSTLPEGSYTLSAVATSGYGNTSAAMPMGSITIDRTPPTIAVTNNGAAFSGGSLSALSGLVLGVQDNLDPAPAITSVAISGGPGNISVVVPVDPAGTNQFTLESPVLFPSAAANDYTLTVSAVDWQGNTSTVTIPFTYAPPTVAIGAAGKLYIPAVGAALHDANGNWPLTTQPMSVGGAPLSGSYPVLASLTGASTAGLMINGVAVHPGDANVPLGTVTITNGVVSLPMAALANAQGQFGAGTAYLLLSVPVPGAPMGQAVVSVYSPAATIAVSKPTMTLGFDQLSATGTTSSGCTVTSDPAAAKGAAAGSSPPVCLWQWSNSGLPVIVDSTGLTYQGEMTQIGSYTLSGQVSVVDSDGTVYPITTAQAPVTVKDARGTVTLGATTDMSTIYRQIAAGTVNFGVTGGMSCTLTDKQSDAEAAAGNTKAAVCLVNWTSVPQGFQTGATSMTGVFPKGPVPVGMQAIWYSAHKQPIVVADQTISLTAADPPAPTVSFQSYLGGTPAQVPSDGGMAGSVAVSSEANAAMTVSVTDANGNSIFSSDFSKNSYGGHFYRSFVLRVPPQPALLQAQNYTVNVAYTAAPDVTATGTVTVMAVPPNTVVPVLSLPSTKVLTTDTVPATVTLQNGGQYGASSTGLWKVAVGTMDYSGAVTPLSSWLTLDDSGTASTSIVMKDVPGNPARLVAIAQPVSVSLDKPRVSDIVPVVINPGGPVPFKLKPGATSGIAPYYVARLQVDVTDPAYRAAAKVQWQQSLDGGQTWTDLPTPKPDTAYAARLSQGAYEYRVVVTNTFSGIATTSDPVTMTAFDRLAGSLTGTGRAFVGQTVTVGLGAVADGNTTIDPSQLTIEWSEDQGRTWTSGGASLPVTSAQSRIVPVWAKVKMASSDDTPDAWTLIKGGVWFDSPIPPRIALNAPARAEYGVPQTLSATVISALPNPTYTGVWTFPDGTTANGLTATWTPGDSDLAARNVEIKFSGTASSNGATVSQQAAVRVSVWKFTPLTYGVRAAVAYKYAPSTLRLGLMANGTLDSETTVQWNEPPGVTVDSQNRYGAVLTVAEPGTYTLGATVTDSHGNVFTPTTTVTLSPPPALDVALNLFQSNVYSRAPLTVRMEAAVSGGHPADRVSSLTYSVDGTVVGSGTAVSTPPLPAGPHTLHVDVVTKMGVTASADKVIQVQVPKTPKCALNGYGNTVAWSISASCGVPDARITDYAWTVNGQPVTGDTYHIVLNKTDYPDKPTVSVIATDEAGAQSAPTTW